MRVYLVKPNPLRKRAPFVRILLPLIAGILLDFYFVFPSNLIVGVISLLLILSGCLIIISFYRIFGKEWIAGVALQLILLLSGILVMYLHRDIQVGSMDPATGNSNFYLVKLLGNPLLKSKSHKFSAEVKLLVKNRMAFQEQEKIFVYFSLDVGLSQLNGNTWILFRKPLKPIENFRSIDFDYRNYCRLKHIYAQVFLEKSDFSIFSREDNRNVFSWLDLLRGRLLSIIKSLIPDKSEYSLLEALLVGYTADLDPALMKSYSDTGVVHIIAISGMHLALICQILQVILLRTGPQKSGRWIKWAMLVICLWGYSLLSGGSPSVVRAATMFTLVLFAKTIIRENSFYNTLAASAFVLICFDPYWLWDIGFQLSYAAILGLSLFSKSIQDIYLPKNKLIAGVWESVAVSVAAQILTSPLSIFYFHRFPVYFLIANLLAVPISSIVLAGGIILCICSPVSFLGHPLGRLVEFLIHILNKLIETISRLPGAVIDRIECSLAQLFLTYFILFCFYHFIVRKNYRWLLSALCAVIIFQLLPLLK
jgi:competence protein ComEC